MADSFTVVASPDAVLGDAIDIGDSGIGDIGDSGAVPPRAVAHSGGADAGGPSEPLSAKTKLAFALGGSTDIFGHWFYNGLVDPVYNVFLGLSPIQVSITRATTLLVDACS